MALIFWCVANWTSKIESNLLLHFLCLAFRSIFNSVVFSPLYLVIDEQHFALSSPLLSNVEITILLSLLSRYSLEYINYISLLFCIGRIDIITSTIHSFQSAYSLPPNTSPKVYISENQIAPPIIQPSFQ